MLDAGIAFLERQRPRLGHHLLPRQFRVEQYVGRHIPFGADEGRQTLRIDIEMRARTQMADFTARQHDPKLRIIGAARRYRLLEVAFGPLAIIGMDGIRPKRCRHQPARLAGLVETMHLCIPQDPVLLDAVLPDTDLGCIESEFEPTQKILELPFGSCGFDLWQRGPSLRSLHNGNMVSSRH